MSKTQYLHRGAWNCACGNVTIEGDEGRNRVHVAFKGLVAVEKVRGSAWAWSLECINCDTDVGILEEDGGIIRLTREKERTSVSSPFAELQKSMLFKISVPRKATIDDIAFIPEEKDQHPLEEEWLLKRNLLLKSEQIRMEARIKDFQARQHSQYKSLELKVQEEYRVLSSRLTKARYNTNTNTNNGSGSGSGSGKAKQLLEQCPKLQQSLFDAFQDGFEEDKKHQRMSVPEHHLDEENWFAFEDSTDNIDGDLDGAEIGSPKERRTEKFIDDFYVPPSEDMDRRRAPDSPRVAMSMPIDVPRSFTDSSDRGDNNKNDTASTPPHLLSEMSVWSLRIPRSIRNKEELESSFSLI